MNKLKMAAVTCVLGLGLTACGSTSSTAVDTSSNTPKACLDALNDAESLIHGPVLGQFSENSSLINLISKAFDAGSTGNAYEEQQVIDGLKQFTARTKTRTADVQRLVTQYNADSAKCRDSAGSNS